MSFKSKFGKLGKILLLSTAMAAAPISNANAQMTNAHQMEYNGEKITFMRSRLLIKEKMIGRENAYNLSNAQNTIVVEKPSGKKVIYIDLWGDDYQIDRIGIEQNGKSNQYDRVTDTEDFFQEGQERFNYYMQLIKSNQAKKLLD